MSWITDPNKRKVQLNASPNAFQYDPSKPSSTSNHCYIQKKKKNWFLRLVKTEKFNYLN